MTQVELAERNVRSKENAVGKSEKELSYLEAQHTVKKSQSKSDIETAEFNHDLAQRKIGLSVNSVQEQAAMQKRILDKMEENFAKGSLYSPKEGTVVLEPEWDRDGRRSLRAGDEIWGTRWLCKITDPATLQVIVGIDEAISNKLKVGQDAIISVKGILNREYAGKVISVGSVAHRYDPWEDEAANDPNRRVFDVVVKLLKPDPKLLRPGMKAKVRLVFKRIPKTIYIPSEAIFAKPSKGEVVYVQQGAGFEERRVKISERNDESVAIQSGLRPKDRVALKDPTRIEEK
jgi:multidrug efflux pump subunit AcrA (membrane-fusion protein)